MLFELKTPVTYTENENVIIEQQGTYQIELFGASGNGGKASEYNEVEDNGTVNILIAAGGGGGGGGYFSAKIEMSINDQINFTAGKVGNTTSAKITHNLEECEINISTGGNGEDGVTDSFQSLKGGNGGLGGEVEYNENNFFNEIIANKNGSYGAAGQTNEDNIIPSEANNFSAMSVGDASGGDGGCPGINMGGQGAGGNKHYFADLTELRTPGSGQNGFIKITLIEEDTTTNPDPETPSQPSTTTSNILTGAEIKALKSKLGTEIQARCWYGSINTTPYNKTILNNEDVATANDVNEIYDTINKFKKADNTNNDYSNINTTNPIISTIKTYINDIDSNVDNLKSKRIANNGIISSNHGCKTLCLGTCYTKCVTTCGDACGGNCSQTCGTTSQGNLTMTQEETCQGCDSGCYASNEGIAGASGCYGCMTYCNTCASGCGAACETTCQQGCEGGNKSSISVPIECNNQACMGNCSASCRVTCGADCELCSSTCSSKCIDKCTGCTQYCQLESNGGVGTTEVEISCRTLCSGGCYAECKTGCGTTCSQKCSQSCGDTCSESCTSTSYIV